MIDRSDENLRKVYGSLRRKVAELCEEEPIGRLG